MPTHPLTLVIVSVTSLIAVVLGARGWGLQVVGLRAALGQALETVGVTVVFFVANVLAGMTLVLVARRVTPYYLTLYEVADVGLLVLSVLQALTVQAWRRTRN